MPDVIEKLEILLARSAFRIQLSIYDELFANFWKHFFIDI